nr:MAG TPA: hypothetical protein [Caudoviricetes sp.]
MTGNKSTPTTINPIITVGYIKRSFITQVDVLSIKPLRGVFLLGLVTSALDVYPGLDFDWSSTLLRSINIPSKS